MTPLFATWLVERTGDEIAPAFLIMAAAAVTFVTVLWLRETYRSPFIGSDAAALYAYLKTVPKIRKAVPRPVYRAPEGASAGKQTYYRYGCPACHGDSGVGVGDLRQAAAHYPTDAQLEAWIKNPSSFKPGTRMPRTRRSARTSTSAWIPYSKR